MTTRKKQPNPNPAADLNGFVEKLINSGKLGLPFELPMISENNYVRDLFHNQKSNEYLDTLNLDWIYKAFPYPEIIFNEQLFMASLRKEITNPIEAIRFFFLFRNFPNKISFKLFYTKVICNAYVKNNEYLNAVLNVLEVAKNTEKAIENIEELMFRHIYDKEYANMIRKCAIQKKKVNVFASNDFLKKEMLGPEAYFSGEIILPENCYLIRTKKVLEKEGIVMRHCIRNFDEALLTKAIFIIQMKEPERVTFSISEFHNTNWFYIIEAKGVNNAMPGRIPLEIMGRSIASEQNQAFFRDNHFKDSELEKLIDML
jgi:hypothetical protein